MEKFYGNLLRCIVIISKLIILNDHRRNMDRVWKCEYVEQSANLCESCIVSSAS